MVDASQQAPVLHTVVVSPSATWRAALCAAIRQAGHGAHEEWGVAHLAQNAYDTPSALLQPGLRLLLIDADLASPELQRWIVWAQALQTQRWLPVVIVGTSAAQAHAVGALRDGADDYWALPVDADWLQAKLDQYAKMLGMQARCMQRVQRQQNIHNNIMDALLTLNHAGQVEEANPAAVRLLGLHWEPQYPKDCAEVLGITLSQALAQRELSLTRADGSRFAAELAIQSWGQAPDVHYTLVIHDLTERQRVQRIKEEFLASISHELRTPLTSVLGALSLLASGVLAPLPPPLLPLAQVAQRNGERLGRLIDDVLDLTKLEGNQMPMHLQNMALEPLVQEALSANQGYAQQAQVHLRSTMAPACPAVRLDADRFLQIMANLLSNAIKHSDTNGTVWVELTHDKADVQIHVRDSGPGIDPQFQARLFEKFSQADSSDRRTQSGTGLGLYITRILVERMGGRISAHSAAGQGTTFTVEFAHA